MGIFIYTCISLSNSILWRKNDWICSGTSVRNTRFIRYKIIESISLDSLSTIYALIEHVMNHNNLCLQWALVKLPIYNGELILVLLPNILASELATMLRHKNYIILEKEKYPKRSWGIWEVIWWDMIIYSNNQSYPLINFSSQFNYILFMHHLVPRDSLLVLRRASGKCVFRFMEPQ